MTVTQKAFHLPPYISTSWSHVVSLHMEQEDHEQLLVVTLTNGAQICIPGLEERLLRRIFAIHAEVLEQGVPPSCSKPVQPEREAESARVRTQRAAPNRDTDMAGGVAELGVEGPWETQSGRLGLLDNLPLSDQEIAELEQQLLDHRPELTESPDLPTALLQRMSVMGQFLHPDILEQMPRAVAGCRCPFCQLHRVLHREPPDTALPPVEEVSEQDLLFRSWIVQDCGDHLFEVTNSTDPAECYRVFVGEPVGCTCGRHGCEHVKAVLLS